MSEVTAIPPGVLYGAFAAMGAAVAALWAFLSKSIDRERRRSDNTTLSLREELDKCEVRHEEKDEELKVLSGKVNTIIGHNEGYLAARAELRSLPEAVGKIDHSVRELSGQVLAAIHHKEDPHGPATGSG